MNRRYERRLNCLRDEGIDIHVRVTWEKAMPLGLSMRP
ncbi:Uncharacterised protein [Klebsiella grimontii]|uniref:Uncharacterized protein n=1 Tax=Klebsiella grimontii TaxID=2058152 RepID=A0A7H4P0A1_9ENTR|nr:Uncharacterised protein [Klebsiella grimontii]